MRRWMYFVIFGQIVVNWALWSNYSPSTKVAAICFVVLLIGDEVCSAIKERSAVEALGSIPW